MYNDNAYFLNYSLSTFALEIIRCQFKGNRKVCYSIKGLQIESRETKGMKNNKKKETIIDLLKRLKFATNLCGTLVELAIEFDEHFIISNVFTIQLTIFFKFTVKR